jgi:hypothetical protein
MQRGAVAFCGPSTHRQPMQTIRARLDASLAARIFRSVLDPVVRNGQVLRGDAETRREPWRLSPRLASLRETLCGFYGQSAVGQQKRLQVG